MINKNVTSSWYIQESLESLIIRHPEYPIPGNLCSMHVTHDLKLLQSISIYPNSGSFFIFKCVVTINLPSLRLRELNHFINYELDFCKKWTWAFNAHLVFPSLLSNVCNEVTSVGMMSMSLGCCAFRTTLTNSLLIPDRKSKGQTNCWTNLPFMQSQSQEEQTDIERRVEGRVNRSTGHIVLCVCWEGVDAQLESVLKATVTPAWKILTQFSLPKCNQVRGTNWNPEYSFSLSGLIRMSSRFNLKFILNFTSSRIKRIEIDIKFDYEQLCCIKFGPLSQFKERAAHQVSISGFGTELFFFWSLKAIIGQNFYWGSLLNLSLQICQSKSWCLF